MPHVSTTHLKTYGTVIGNGHCVHLVRQTTGLPHTSLWRRGDPVRGSGCAPGTAIATFDEDGSYGNHVDGRSHAALLLAENSDGIVVCDCWRGQPVHERTIKYREGQGDAANDADRFYVVELRGTE